MKKEILINTGITMGVILAIPTIFFVGYFFLAFVVWIFNDPLDFIPDQSLPRVSSFENLPAYKECVKNGGTPIISGWSREVKRCDK